jgi:hypothetical protein
LTASLSPAFSPAIRSSRNEKPSRLFSLVDLGSDGVDFCRRLPDIGFNDLMRLGGKALCRLVAGKLGRSSPRRAKVETSVSSLSLD